PYDPFGAAHSSTSISAALGFAAARDLGGAGGFVYAYHPDYDALAHQFGIASAQCSAHFHDIDAMVERLVAQLAGLDAVLLVTADHGFIDAPDEKQIRLDHHPELYACLDGPLWGERRVVYCRIRPGVEDRFEAAAEALLKDRVDVVASRSLIDAGLFGPARKPSRQLARRVGDYTLIGRAGWTVFDVLPQERESRMIGVHAGVSAEEMLIPLLAISC
ncbi:MAG: alkaline phosphatase family protein, partial [Caldilineaceae bacterium]|nr:alkaline phosphatase family protein [Caldilineaceae bacterium]